MDETRDVSGDSDQVLSKAREEEDNAGGRGRG